MTIYDIVGENLQLKEMMEADEISPETFKDMLELNESDIADKLDGYGRVMKELSYESEALKKEADRLYEKSEVLSRNIKRMKETIMFAMQAMEIPKVKTELFSFNVQNNAPSVVMDEQYIENIPEEYLRIKDPEIDKAKIKEALKNGVNLEGIAHLEQTQSLRIR